MTKSKKNTSDLSALWEQQRIRFFQSSVLLGERAAAAQAEPLTSASYVLEQLEEIWDEASEVFVESGLPTQPGIYREIKDGGHELVADGSNPAANMSGHPEGKSNEFYVWPDFPGIPAQTALAFARDLLLLVHRIRRALEDNDDVWTIAQMFLWLCEPYYQLEIARSNIGANALRGVEVVMGGQRRGRDLSEAMRVRREIVDAEDIKYLASKASAQQKSVHFTARKILDDVNASLTARGAKAAKIETIRKDIEAVRQARPSPTD